MKQELINNNNDEAVLRELVNGKYRDCYLVYNRKSTDEPENQKNSIKYQKSENMRFAYRENLRIAPITLNGFSLEGIISEKHSGFKESNAMQFGKDGTIQYRIERPKFYQLVNYLSKGYIKGVIFLSWDRASRNKGDGTVIRKLMNQGIDFRFTLASYDKSSAGQLHMDIDGMFAEHNSRVTSEKVSLTIKNKREQGFCTYRAPVGYLNQGQMEHKPIDQKRAPIVKRLFELYATCLWSIADLAKWATEQGFTMSPSRRPRTKVEMLAEEDEDIASFIAPICRPPTTGNIHAILTNRFYTGETKGNNGEYVKSNSHKALINQDLFNKVQLLLRQKKVSVHYTKKLPFPLRGLIRCGICNRVYSPYLKKGNTYLGCRCTKDCTNGIKNINIKNILDTIGNEVENLSFTDVEIDEINAQAWQDDATMFKKQSDENASMERQKEKIKEDLMYLADNKLLLLKTGAYSPELLVQEEKILKNTLDSFEEKINNSLNINEIIGDVLKLSELLKNLYLYYGMANPYEKQRIIQVIFSELTLSENILKYQCRLGFKSLERPFIRLGAPSTWDSEGGQIQSAIKESIEEVKELTAELENPVEADLYNH